MNSVRSGSASRALSIIDSRRVDADDSALRQALEQEPGHPAAPAAGVEHGLVAAKVEPVEDRPRPDLLHVGDAVVRRRIPLARLGLGSAARLGLTALW